MTVEDPESAMLTAAPEQTRPLKVLITEDSPTIRGFLRRNVNACLEKPQVEECEDGTHAMQCLKRLRIDLVITDLQMPNLSGEAFLKQSLAEGLLKDTAVIVISSAITPRIREALKDFKRLAFLRKPATGDDIAHAIRSLLPLKGNKL